MSRRRATRTCTSLHHMEMMMAFPSSTLQLPRRKRLLYDTVAITNEADNGLKNDRGTLSMARTSDPNSATSQFFVNLTDNAPLNPSRGNAGYAVFGKVTDGMDVVDKIAAGPTGSAGPFRQDAPQNQVVIETAEVVED